MYDIGQSPRATRFATALLALRPADWDAVAAAIRAETATNETPRLPRALRYTSAFVLGIHIGLRTFVPAGVRALGWQALAIAGDRLGPALEGRVLGPAWRRQGTGILRRLGETLERSYVAPVARSRAAMILGMLTAGDVAPYTGFVARVAELYRPFEPLIPRASLEPAPVPGAEPAA